jgi:tRNA(His) guanylyltransferase
MSKDSLGDRMKSYEQLETDRRLMPLLPIYARIDGRSFSNYTRGMDRPYDQDMSQCMIDTLRYLIKESNATIGYTQSDEISLVWRNDNSNSEMWFDGKLFKWISSLAALATARFNKEANLYLNDKLSGIRLPTFDCRVFQLPNLSEAANAILWRYNDAVKNSISMAASAYYSHKELQGKNSSDKHEMLHAKGVNWNDYPQHFKEGVFMRRVTEIVEMSTYNWSYLPEPRPKQPFYIERTFIEAQPQITKFNKITNRVEVLFDYASPIFKTE